MSKGIRISKKYGVNPSLIQCNCCGKEYSIVMFGTSYKENGKTAQAPRVIRDGSICDDCQKVIDDGGIFFIEVKDGESGTNPYRTGRISAVKREAIQKIFKKEVSPINYMEESLFTQIFCEQSEDMKVKEDKDIEL